MFMKLLISGAVAAVCEPSLGEGRSPYTERVCKDPGPIQFVSTLERRCRSPRRAAPAARGARIACKPRSYRVPLRPVEVLRGAQSARMSGADGVGCLERVRMTEYQDRQTMERLHQHLARADRELRDAQHFFDPDSAEETEMELVHVVAAARLAVTDALERVRFRLGEPEV
jgi:hypothetical protein